MKKSNLVRIHAKKMLRAKTIMAKVTFVKQTGVPYDIRVKNLESGETEW